MTNFSLEKIRQILANMESEVRKGEFEEAAKIGNAFETPLGLAKADVRLEETLHPGQQGLVFRGSWQDSKVAIKKAKISTNADMARFRTETQLLLLLRQHKNIVPLIGARLLPPDYMLILPLWSQNLAEQLFQDQRRFAWPEVADMALQLAEGLQYIHAAGIIHRDIKPANILTGPNDEIGITDFGIAVLESELASEFSNRQSLVGSQNPSGGFHKRHLVGTLEYLAPEVLLKEPYSYPADIYSWAVAVNELTTATVPFSDCTKENPAAHTVLNFGYGRQELAAAIVSEGLRPLVSPSLPPGLSSILEDCWQLDSSKRPTAGELVARLRDWVSSADFSTAAEAASVSTKQREEARRLKPQQKGDKLHSDGKNVGESRATITVPEWLEYRSQGNMKVSVGHFATAGARGEDRMEDRHVVDSPIDACFSEGHLLAVFDGHRGAQAADFAAQKLREALSKALSKSSGDAALKDCFLELDANFRQLQDSEEGRGAVMPSRLQRFPGCTALVTLIMGTHIWIANAGDSRAIICRGGKALQLSQEHSASLASERRRISDCGGKVHEAHGVWRIGRAGLQVTRSIGDADLKDVGVIAEPEVVHVEVQQDDAFLVLATDGLWDTLSNEAVVKLIQDTVKEPTMCAQRLVTEAITKGSGDNISVIVAFLQPVATVEQIFASSSSARQSD